MRAQDHPGFARLGLREQQLVELLVASDHVEELLPDDGRIELRAAITVAAETLTAIQNGTAFGEERHVLVIGSRGRGRGNDPLSWSRIWAEASDDPDPTSPVSRTRLSRLVSSGTPPTGRGHSLPAVERRRVTFIDENTLSTSDYGLRWAERRHDLVVSDWPQVLAQRGGKRYLFSAKLRSECQTSWVISPSIPESMQFLIGEPGRYLLSLAPPGPAQLRRRRPSALALPPALRCVG